MASKMMVIALLAISMAFTSAVQAGGGDACADLFPSRTPIAASELQLRINEGFRKSLPLIMRVFNADKFSFRISNPFKVIEDTEIFYAGGRLPSFADLTDVRISRLSREEGIRQIRRGVEANEERAWIFVPKLRLWIYDCLGGSMLHNLNNALLAEILVHEFGEIEHFHTHPRAGIRMFHEKLQSSNGSKMTFDRFRVWASFPSTEDVRYLVMDLKKDGKTGDTTSKIVGHIVHEFGVTTYRLRVFHARNAAGDTVPVYPRMGLNILDVLEELDNSEQPLSPAQMIRLLHERIEKHSLRDASECRLSGCHWTPETAPRLILQYTEFEEAL